EWIWTGAAAQCNDLILEKYDRSSPSGNMPGVRVSGVSTAPGETGTTRMRRAASSAARLRENASTAPLDAAYAVMYGFPCVADSEAVLTMTPVPSGRCRSASRQNSAVPTRLTENS